MKLKMKVYTKSSVLLLFSISYCLARQIWPDAGEETERVYDDARWNHLLSGKFFEKLQCIEMQRHLHDL